VEGEEPLWDIEACCACCRDCEHENRLGMTSCTSGSLQKRTIDQSASSSVPKIPEFLEENQKQLMQSMSTEQSPVHVFQHAMSQIEIYAETSTQVAKM
jgi:hypothetical protein